MVIHLCVCEYTIFGTGLSHFTFESVRIALLKCFPFFEAIEAYGCYPRFMNRGYMNYLNGEEDEKKKKLNIPKMFRLNEQETVKGRLIFVVFNIFVWVYFPSVDYLDV